MTMPPGMPHSPRSDTAIVILGAKLTPQGRATPALRRRLTRGLTLAQEMPDAPVIVTGGANGAPHSEAAEMARVLTACALDPARLVKEPKARNTFENALFSLPLVAEAGAGRLILVTDALHMPRAWLCFAVLAGPGLRLRSAAAPRPRGWAAVRAGLREVAALALYAPRLLRACVSRP